MAAVLVLVERTDGAVRKPTLELLTLARRLCSSLAYIHGDLKPDNILVCSDGVPVLVDFGIV